MLYLHFFMEEFLKEISFCSVYFGKVCVRICVCVGVGRVVLWNDSYLKPIPLSTFIWCVQSREKKTAELNTQSDMKLKEWTSQRREFE